MSLAPSEASGSESSLPTTKSVAQTPLAEIKASGFGEQEPWQLAASIADQQTVHGGRGL